MIEHRLCQTITSLTPGQNVKWHRPAMGWSSVRNNPKMLTDFGVVEKVYLNRVRISIMVDGHRVFRLVNPKFLEAVDNVQVE